MKKFLSAVLLSIVLTAAGLMTFTSCSSEEEYITLQGTYVVDSVDNVVLYFSNGTKVDMKAEGVLNYFLTSDDLEEYIEILETVALRFTENNVYLTYEGEEQPLPFTYRLSRNRLNIYFGSAIEVSLGYSINDGTTYFTCDMATLKSVGLESAALFELGVTDLRISLAMSRK